jgi:hypothetical protein
MHTVMTTPTFLAYVLLFALVGLILAVIFDDDGGPRFP